MSRDRVFAVLLFLVLILALAAQRALPFVADASWPVRTAVLVAGVVSGLAGVRLWLRGSTDDA